MLEISEWNGGDHGTSVVSYESLLANVAIRDVRPILGLSQIPAHRVNILEQCGTLSTSTLLYAFAYVPISDKQICSGTSAHKMS